MDAPSVRTVPSDFLEQDVQTETQAQRRDAEKAEAKARAELRKAEAAAAQAKKKAAAKARRVDHWLTSQLASLSEGAASSLVVANAAAVVGLSGFLGFKAYRLYDAGRLDWKTAGVGAGIVGAIAVFESVFGRYVGCATDVASIDG